MSVRINNQHGFAIVEALLLFVILAIAVGTGYFVYHSNKKTTDTLSSASQDASAQPDKTVKKGEAPTVTRPSTPTVSYITISEWGVRAPITDGLTYNKHAETNDSKLSVRFTSTQLAAYKYCQTAGGVIERYAASESVDTNGDTAGQLAKQNPAIVKQVGSYYFVFTHDQSACSEDGQADAAQSTNNTDLLAMMQHLAAY